jgi:hypothetical protein
MDGWMDGWVARFSDNFINNEARFRFCVTYKNKRNVPPPNFTMLTYFYVRVIVRPYFL